MKSKGIVLIVVIVAIFAVLYAFNANIFGLKSSFGGEVDGDQFARGPYTQVVKPTPIINNPYTNSSPAIDKLKQRINENGDDKLFGGFKEQNGFVAYVLYDPDIGSAKQGSVIPYVTNITVSLDGKNWNVVFACNNTARQKVMVNNNVADKPSKYNKGFRINNATTVRYFVPGYDAELFTQGMSTSVPKIYWVTPDGYYACARIVKVSDVLSGQYTL